MSYPGTIARELFLRLVSRPATVCYPRERLTLPPGFRGRPRLDVDRCNGCGLCARECPSEAIDLLALAEKVKRPAFYFDRCTFCGVCAELCPRDAITMSAVFELAAGSREAFYEPPVLPVPEPGSKAGAAAGGGGAASEPERYPQAAGDGAR